MIGIKKLFFETILILAGVTFFVILVNSYQIHRNAAENISKLREQYFEATYEIYKDQIIGDLLVNNISVENALLKEIVNRRDVGIRIDYQGSILQEGNFDKQKVIKTYNISLANGQTAVLSLYPLNDSITPNIANEIGFPLILEILILGLGFIYLVRIFNQKILIPLKSLVENLKPEKIESYTPPKKTIPELMELTRTLKELNVEVKKKALSDIALQVAHDIRSPLAALQVLTEQKLSELEESKRILLRDSVYQIRDIINNLDQKSFSSEITETQVAILLEYVISERRAAFNNRIILIQEHFGVEAYSYFINVIQPDIKRVLTNIINNAAESIKQEDGVINVYLYENGKYVFIKIKDNGCGMSNDVISSIFTRGFTTKSNGKGLGLFHAHETIQQLGGAIEIASEVNKGTSVIISLPAYSPPAWFTAVLKIKKNSILVCVDDSISIWNAWQERFRSINSESIELRYCNDKSSLLIELGKEEDRPATYLVDFEFSEQKYTGIDLIKMIISYKKPHDTVFLVTSRSGKDLQEFCIEHKIFMISKIFALKIPITLVS